MAGDFWHWFTCVTCDGGSARFSWAMYVTIVAAPLSVLGLILWLERD